MEIRLVKDPARCDAAIPRALCPEAQPRWHALVWHSGSADGFEHRGVRCVKIRSAIHRSAHDVGV